MNMNDAQELSDAQLDLVSGGSQKHHRGDDGDNDRDDRHRSFDHDRRDDDDDDRKRGWRHFDFSWGFSFLRRCD
jgi:hypothetical protein